MKYGSITTGIIADGLVFNMDAANRASFIPSDNTTLIYNTVNPSIIGTSANSGIYDNTTISPTLSFGGVSDRINIGSTSLGLTVAISVGAWVKIPTTNTGGPAPNIQEIICEDNTSSRNWALSWRGGGLDRFSFAAWNSTGGATDVNTTGITPNNNTWQYIIGTFTGTTVTDGMRIYVNGVDNNQSTATNAGIRSISSLEPQIGSLTASTSWIFEGNIGPIHIYDRALSANEVLHNYNALKSRFGL